MKKLLKKSKILTKVTALVLCFALFLGFAPLEGVDALVSKASAASDTDLVYNLDECQNFAEENGFEVSDGYTNGSDLQESNGALWTTPSNTKTWSHITVSNTEKNSGSQSMRVYCRNNNISRKVSGLEKNTQYTISFMYYIPQQGRNSQMKYMSVIDADETIVTECNHYMPTLAFKKLTYDEGHTATDEWKEASITFFTADKTDFYLLFYYYVADKGTDDTSDEYCYIDNFSIKLDPMAPPTYANDDFNANECVDDWKVFTVPKLSLSGGRLKAECTTDSSIIQQAKPFYLKEGYTYELSFDMNLSEIDAEYAVKYNADGTPQTNSDGSYVYNTSIPNWINWSLTTEKGKFGSDKKDSDGKIISNSYFYCATDENGAPQLNKVNTTVTYTDTQSNAKTETINNQYTYHTSNGMGAIAWCKKSKDGKFTVKMSFTSDKTDCAYLSFRLNSIGTYYIDNVSITETEPADNNAFLQKMITDHLFKPVALAIKLTDPQGIRYKTRIATELLCSDNPYGITVTEYGTIAMSKKILNGNDLVIDGSYTYNDKTYTTIKGVAYNSSDNTNVIYDSTKNYIYFTGVLTNITIYQDDYVVRSYLKYKMNNQEYNIYSDTSESSIYELAKEAYTAKTPDGNFAQNEQQRKYLFDEIINKNTDASTDKTVKISDTSAPISTGFDGINSTVYHCFTFMNDTHNRAYTEAQAAKEMDRLKDSGIESVRTMFKSSFAAKNLSYDYDETSGTKVVSGERFDGWNWDSVSMTAFYKWAKMLQDRDIDIILNPGWHLQFMVEKASSIPELHYFLGFKEGETFTRTVNGTEITISVGYADKYNETNNYIADGGVLPADKEERRILIASLRYAEWVKQALKACKERGINNITYINPFTETGYLKTEKVSVNGAIKTQIKDGYIYKEWITMVQSLHNALKKAGIRNNYSIIGPSQALYQSKVNEINEKIKSGDYLIVDSETGETKTEYTPFLKYYLDWEKENPEYKGMVDILSSHQYTRPAGYGYGVYTSILDPYACYATAEENFTYYNQLIEDNAEEDNRPFWCDEYFAYAEDEKWLSNAGNLMTQFAAGMTAAMNNGTNRLISWQLFDQVWTSQKYTNAEFIGGVHAVGTCPSFPSENSCSDALCSCHDYDEYASYTPRVTYYGINLLGKYLSNQKAKVYKTAVSGGDENGGLYVSAICDNTGKVTVLAVNTQPYSTRVDFNFDVEPCLEATRYTYNPAGITPTEDATSIPSDGKVTVSEGKFTDVIAPMSFSIYVLDDFGKDYDIEMDLTEEDF